jgi:hypothetical protein
MKTLTHTVGLLTAGLLAAAASTASAAFLIPNSTTPPFTAWSRGGANSTYAEWNVFTAGHTNPNAPDVGTFGPAGAALVQANTTAFVTSGGNIYSFAAATDFDVVAPSLNLGAGHATRVVAQIATLGTPLLESSLALSYIRDAVTLQAPRTSATFTSVPNPAGGNTEEWTVVWDVPDFNPASLLLEFKASGSSMSLDRLAVDAFARPVPEPTAIGLAAAGVGLAAVLRRRK